jgi:hypothetical protein
MCNEALENKWLLRYLLKTVKKEQRQMVELVCNLMAHGDAREGKWRGNRSMEWVASTLTRSRKVVYPALLPLMRTPRLPTVDWTDSPADLNGLVLFGERRTLVYARVPSGFKRAILTVYWLQIINIAVITCFLRIHYTFMYKEPISWRN